MADEGGLAYLIQVAVDSSAVGPGISEAENIVAAGMARINETLQQSTGVQAFQQLIEAGNGVQANLREITAAAQGAREVLTGLAEARRLLAEANVPGTATLGGSLAGVSQEALAAEQIRLQQLRSQANDQLTPVNRTLFNQVNTGTVADAENLAAALSREGLAGERAQAALDSLATLGYRGLAEAARSYIAVSDAVVNSENQVNEAFRQNRALTDLTGVSVSQVNEMTDALTRQAGVQAEINALLEARRGETLAITQANVAQSAQQQRVNLADSTITSPLQVTRLAQGQLSVQAQQERAQAALSASQINPLLPVKETSDAIAASVEGLSAKVAKATLDESVAQERVRILTQTGTATYEQQARAAATLTAAKERLRVATEAEAAAAGKEAAAAAGSGGGGLFAGLSRGLGSHGDGSGAEDLGFQVGQVARYVVYYQIFRDIETAIKDSINETVEFERGITNLSLQLGVSRDNARSLATELGNVAAANGLNPSQGAALGGQFAGSFSDQPGADPAALATQGANIGSQLAVVSGAKEVSKNLFEATASVHGFNLEASDTNRVLDAATNAAGHFLGAMDPTKILPGLAQIGDVAAAAGFSVEQTASLLGAVQQRTGSDSAAAAQELRRILGREGQPAFQAVFAQQNINTSLPLQQELTQLAAKYDTLSTAQQRAIVSQLGGSRGGAAVQAILEGYSQIDRAASQSVENGGAFAQAYGQRLNDLRGLITQLRGEFGLLAKDLGESGAFAGLGIALIALKDLVVTADDVLQIFNQIPSSVRNIGFALAEVVAVARGLGALGVTGFGVGAANAGLNSFTAARFGGRTLPGGGAAAGAETGAGTTTAAGAATEEIVAAGTQISEGLSTAGAQLIASVESLALQLSRVGAQEEVLQAEVATQIRLAQGLALNSAGQIIGAGGRFVSPAVNTAGLAAEDAAAAEAAARMKAGATAIEAAENEVAVQVETGGRAVYESLDGAGVYISRAARAAAAEIEAAGAQGAAGIRAGGAAGGELGAAEGAGAGAATRGGVAAGAGLALGVAVAAVATDAVVRKIGSIASASDTANGVTITGSTAEDLRSAADSAKTAAQDSRQASSGLLGTIVNALEGNRTGGAAGRADQIASLALFEANRLDRTATTTSGGAAIDLTAVDGVAVAFKQMTAEGVPAVQMLNELNQRLDEFNQAAVLGVNTITAAQAPRLGQDIADSATNSLTNQGVAAQQAAEAAGRARVGARAFVPAGARLDEQQQALAALRGVNLESLNSGLSDAVEQALKQQGVASGGTVDPARLRTSVQQAGVRILENLGLSPEQVRSLAGVLNTAEQSAITAALQAATGSRGQRLTDAQIGAAAQQVIATSPKVGAQVQADVASGTVQSSESPTLAAAKATLAADKTAYQKLLTSSGQLRQDVNAFDQLSRDTGSGIGQAGALLGAVKAPTVSTANALRDLKTKKEQDETAVADATIAQVQALTQLAQSGQVNKFQGIQNQIAGVQSAIAVAASDTAQLPGLAASLASLEVQSGDQAEADAEALILASVKVGDAMSAALAQYQVAVLRLARLQQQLTNLNGATYASQVPSQAAQSPDVATLQQAATQAGVNVQLQKISDQTNNALAGLDPQQTVQIDQTNIQGTKDKLAALAKNNLQGTTDYVTAQTQLKQQLRQLSTDQAAAAAASIAAGAGGSTSAQNAAAVAEAAAKLKGDLPGTTQYNQDLAAYHQAQAAQAKAAAGKTAPDPFNSGLELGIDPRDTLKLAAAKLLEDAHAAATAKDQDSRNQALLKQAQDQLALAQAQAAQANAQGLAGDRRGDTQASAVTTLANARRQLELDLKGTQQYWQDYGALQDAKYALAQANLDQSKIVDQLRSDTTDPVAQARIAVTEAQRKLNADKRDKTGNIEQDQLDLETAKTAKQKAAFDQTVQQQQTAFSLGQESAKTYDEFLTREDKLLRTKISGMKKGQQGYQQYVDELNTIDQAIQSLNNELQGQFNLGDIKLPTVYEVRRQVAANSAGNSVVTNSPVTNNVEINGVDFQAVVNYLASILGRGGAVVATTGRKAA